MAATLMTLMVKRDQVRSAENFREMHRRPTPLLLPNCWDAISARIFESSGFEAVGTTSGGMAWALGFRDGECTPWSDIVAATERIVRTVRVPVSVDIERGYGDTPEQVAANVADIIRAGAAGINLEDSTAHGTSPIRSLEDSVDRIRAAREAASRAGIPIVINARVDVYSKHIGEAETRFAETVKRAKAYIAAGADCVFPFGVTDLATIADLVRAIQQPLNIVGRFGMPGLADLARLGVARVSTASGPALVILSKMKEVAETLRNGDFGGLETSVKRADAQQLFAAREGVKS